MRKIILKRIAVFFAVFFLLAGLFPAVNVRAEEDPADSTYAGDTEESVLPYEIIDSGGDASGFFYNPAISDIESEEEVYQELLKKEASGNQDSSEEGELPCPETFESVSTTAQAGLVLRQGLKNHETSIEMITTCDMSSSESRSAIWKKAYEHTGDPLEGDYIARQFKGGTYRNHNNGDGTWLLTLTPDYYTTAAQESALSQKVRNILIDLNLWYDHGDARTAIRKIYDYICANVTYDNEHNDDYKLKYTAYAALVNGTAVCQGYSVAFYRLILTCGIDCRYIRGYDQNGDNHSWNIAKLGSLYFNLDPTWDAGKTRYSWYLKGRGFFPRHTRRDEFDTAAFHAKYPMFDGLGVVDYPELESKLKGIQVSWEPAANALFYEVQRALAKGDIPSNEWEYISLGTTNDTSFLDTTCGVNHQYSYRICPAVPVFTDEPGRPRVDKWEPFEDVHSYQSYAEAVAWAVRKDIIKGTSETTFSPHAECVRYQFAVMLYKYAGQPEVPAGASLPFKDVSKKKSYYKAVLWAYNKGIISGTSKTSFSPNDPIKRYQAVQMLYKYLGRPAIGDVVNPFSDVSKEDSYYRAIMWAVKEGITVGTGAETFSPMGVCERYQMVVFLYKFNYSGNG